ncbi:MAG: helix-turn-helix domain-containing protein [Candidatus Obscuribacterales bacterium]
MKKRDNKKPDIEFTKSSGNVFADLGLPDADVLQAKAKLVHQIALAIKKRKLTQRQAAKILEIDQPKISALLHGRLSGFSMDRLIRFLAKLEKDIDIVVKSRPVGPHRAGLIAVHARPR